MPENKHHCPGCAAAAEFLELHKQIEKTGRIPEARDLEKSDELMETILENMETDRPIAASDEDLQDCNSCKYNCTHWRINAKCIRGYRK